MLLHWTLAATGRRLSEATAGGERGCTPLLTAKYEPNITLGGVLQAKLQPASSQYKKLPVKI